MLLVLHESPVSSQSLLSLDSDPAAFNGPLSVVKSHYSPTSIVTTVPATVFYEPPTASVLALEFKELLETVRVKPPYVVIAHSYGGILARESFAVAKRT